MAAGQRKGACSNAVRSRMNCLLLKQSFFTKELQAGNLHRLVQLNQVHGEIKEWYEIDSRKLVLQSRVDDVQQSEKVRIYHHEQHVKHCKKSAILKLDTKDGLLIGHEACSDFLVGQVIKLLGEPAVLDPDAQKILLSEVTPVFTEEDNKALEMIPDKDEVREVLFKSNFNAASGTDWITSLLYRNTGNYLVTL